MYVYIYANKIIKIEGTHLAIDKSFFYSDHEYVDILFSTEHGKHF